MYVLFFVITHFILLTVHQQWSDKDANTDYNQFEQNSGSSFDLNIGTNTDKVTGLQARNLEAKLNEKLAGAGRSVSSGDRFLVMTRKGKYIDASLYQPGQADQLNRNTPEADTKRVLQAEAVGYGGENISFRDVTQDVLAQEKMERGAAEGENVAEVAGDGEGGGEYVFEGIPESSTTIIKGIEAYNRKKHYGNTPTKADKSIIGGESVDHDPPLVKRYYEGDPTIGERPGFMMTQKERYISGRDRTRMKPSTLDEQRKQGAEMAMYSKEMKKKHETK